MIEDTVIIDFANSVDFLDYRPEKLSDSISRKFIETFNVNDYEVLSNNGFVNIKKIGKTIPYLKYKIKTTNHTLECADDHIIIDSDYDEIFAKDLNKDSRPDKIITDNGIELVTEVINTGEYEEMYDLELDESSNHLFFTNGILSHNSIWLAQDAANFVKMGYNTVFITAEMQAHKVIKRIGANLLNISISEYDIKSKDAAFIQRSLDTVGTGLIPPGQLFVKKFPTSQATVLDIENYILDLQETTGHKVGPVVIDYINILCNYRNPNSENTYMKIKQIAEDLRGIADKHGWLIITATQIKRCLTLDTIVNTKESGDIEIKYLHEDDEILSETGYVHVKKIHAIEKQKVYLVKTRSGKQIKMSSNHITPTVIGNKKTTDLCIGDSIFIKKSCTNE